MVRSCMLCMRYWPELACGDHMAILPLRPGPHPVDSRIYLAGKSCDSALPDGLGTILREYRLSMVPGAVQTIFS